MAKTKLTTLENANQTLHALEAKRAETAQARAGDQTAMDECSYSAHTGDQKAEAKLETLRERLLRKDLEIRSLDSAIHVAKERVALAQADEAAADQRRVLLEARGLLKSLRDAGAVCDNALAEFAAGSNAMREIIQRMNAIGFTHPSSTQLVSLGERAVRGTLVNTPFARAFETIAPRERQTSTTSPADGSSRWSARLQRGSVKLNQGRRSHDRQTSTKQDSRVNETQNFRGERCRSRSGRAV